MKLDYRLIDVFTQTQLAGNPLAIVMNGDDVPEGRMQAVASELNLPETVFVSKPKTARSSASIRIFTPKFEIPFAGHPTVGVAVTLGLESRASAIRIEEKIGLITCVLEQLGKRDGFARFALPKLPGEVGKAPETRHIAAALGLVVDDIGFGPHMPSVYSAGTPYYLVPVKSPAVLAKIVPELRGWSDNFTLGFGGVYVYTETPREHANQYAARMFAPGTGLWEDPATGSAAAALLGELCRYAEEGQHEFVLRQGHEMGRPSQIHLQFRKGNGELTHGGIGGHAVVVGQGTLDLSD
jgi:trans-2,3-dihydro-3-hydroxyanthranilate isomerase